MKLRRRILGLEIHKYAPELNTLVFLCGCKIKVPNKTTIKEALNFLCPKARKEQRYAKIDVLYPEQLSYCNKTYKGSFKNSSSLLEFIKGVKDKHQIDTSELLYNNTGLTGLIKPQIKINFK